MACIFCTDTFYWRKWAGSILSLFWTVGLICGFLVFRCAGESAFYLIRQAVCSPVSIASLLISLMLPFLVSALAVYLSKPQFLLIIAFCKAFLMIYVSLCVCHVFGSAGWLVRILYMSGDILSTPLLYRCWLKQIRQDSSFRFAGSTFFFLTVFVVGCVDYF